MRKARTDTERLDWLEENADEAILICDDNGKWAVSWRFCQPMGMRGLFLSWKNTVREAIDAAMGKEEG